MRSGGSKQKGSGFERTICTKLSLWVSGGKDEDLFWRSAMSGGRATVAHRKGRQVRQAGDICAVSPEGHVLTDKVYLECKHYRDLKLTSFILKGQGTLAKFWRKTEAQAKLHNKMAWLIAKQNNMPIMLLTNREFTLESKAPVARLSECKIWLFETLLSVPFERLPL